MNRLQVVISAQTFRDIDEAIFYQENLGIYPENLEKFKKELFTKINGLALSPKIGVNLSARITIETKIKYLLIQDYILFYEIFTDQVQVIRLLPAKSDWMTVIMKNL